MAQSFRENAHLRTDQEKYNEGWDRIFGKKKDEGPVSPPICPKCGCKDLRTERRPDGDTRCMFCHFSAKTKEFNSEN